MFVQVVTYELKDMSEREYLDVANRLAQRFSMVPGLQAKIWLDGSQDADRAYGAIYFWDDRESMERFEASDLAEAGNPDFVHVASAGYDVLENLTRMTQPVLEVVEAKKPPARSGS